MEKAIQITVTGESDHNVNSMVDEIKADCKIYDNHLRHIESDVRIEVTDGEAAGKLGRVCKDRCIQLAKKLVNEVRPLVEDLKNGNVPVGEVEITMSKIMACVNEEGL